ncbi:MAG: hypothetical protein IIB64_08845 [Proteobacteria bacterium]|nr:hypothetical protein [Pseudomonadota bacterium]
MNSFFAELKRRNVVRVAVAYVVVAWVILQFIDVIQDPMSLPDWFQKVTIVFLGIGLPIALLMSWAYEVTPEGVKKTEEVDKSKSVTHGTGQKINKLIIGALVLAVGFIIYDKTVAPVDDGAVKTREASIAVLPFIDLSKDGDQQYFGDGIAEEILNVLARIPEMKVAGRTSSFQFKGQNPDLRAIGELLNVDHVLEGSIRKDGNRIRITVQLIAADDGFQLWSETYDRELVDIFAIQDQISEAVAEALKIQLGAGEEIVVEQETDSPEGYDLYLRGHQYFHLRGVDNMQTAIKLYEVATVLDPEFSSAWSALAIAYALIPYYIIGEEDFKALYEKGKAAADFALELDPKNAEAYSALTFIHDGLYQWREGEISNAKAIALAPNDAEIANFAGDHYRLTFDTVNAVKWERRAYELDPLHHINSRDLAFAYLGVGDFVNALKAINVAMDLAPNFDFNIHGKVYVLANLGQFEEAHEILTQWKTKPQYDPFILFDAQTYLALREGREEQAGNYLGQMAQMVLAGDGISSFIYPHFLDLGDIDAALVWFEKAHQQYSPFLVTLGNFLPENYTDDPELLARFNLPGMKELFDIRRRNIAKNAREEGAS